MPEDETPRTPADLLLRVIDNLARFHREHEEYHAQAPLRQAGELQARSRALKSPAPRRGGQTRSPAAGVSGPPMSRRNGG
ncbi:hypothetical protein [Streptomyces sp. NPDC003522]